MNHIAGNVVTYGMVLLGVTGVNPSDFSLPIFLFYYAFILIIAGLTGYYFETEGWDKLKKFCKRWTGKLTHRM